MIDLRAIREKASWQLVVFILLYLVAALVFLAVFLPTHCRKKDLLAEIERVEMAADNLLRVVSGRSTLETQKMDVQRRLYALGQRIPSQYDLFAVLELITELSTSAGVTLESLEHVPLEANSSSASGVIPLSFILTGDGTVYSLILQLQELLPTLQITELLLVYIGDGQFQVMVDADLRVLILGRASASNWQRPAQTPLELVNLPNLGFGVPFEILAQFLQPNVKVLGVVEAGKGSRVLLSRNGVQRWYTVGERFGEAVISDISRDSVWLDLDGVQLRLNLGS